METALTGQMIRGYEVGDVIGQGGYGAVYRAHQPGINRDVAIKVILPEHANKAEFQQRFEAEAQLIAQLEHPHIIPLYDYWQDENGAFLVMRYVATGTLEELIQRESPLEWSQVNRLFLQVIEALEVAHDNGVIHRDIKPANILLDDRGNAYLTDFGLAWMVGTDEESTAAGTVAYMSPETIARDVPSPQSDLYSLGILLYEMLTGRQPYTGTVSQVIMGHLNEDMPSVFEVRSDIPEVIDEVIDRLTLKDPQDRYSSVKQLRLALEDVAVAPSAKPKATISMVAMRPGLDKLAQKRGNTLGLRNRFSMLNAVYTYWIEGVLENLLSGYALLDLDLNLEPHYVGDIGDDETAPIDEEALAIAEQADSILKIFEAYNGKLLILGEAGTGKSTLLLALARDLLHQASEDEDFPIPVIFNLSSWDGKLPMAEWLASELNEKYQVPQAVAKRWVDEDALLLLLDGLDEVRIEHRQNCMDTINAWRSDHPFTDIVVTSRVVDYEARSGQLDLNGCVVIQPLTDEQVGDYLNGIGGQTSGLQTILQDNAEMRELSRSPLMLGVMITAYKDVTSEELPDFASLDGQRNYFFDLYVRRAWERRQAEKQFSLDEMRMWFASLASQMQANTQTMFFVEDLQPTWLPAQARPQFHRVYPLIMAVIFSAAWFISSLLFLDGEYLYYLAMGAVWGWAMFYASERFGLWRSLLMFVVLASILRITLDADETVINYFQKSFFRSTLPYTLIMGIMIALYRRTGQTLHTISSVDALNFSLRSMRWTGLVAGMAGGFLVSIPNIFFENEFSIVPVVIKIIVPGLIGLIITGFRSNQVQQSAAVNEKIHRSLRNGLKMGLVGGVFAMLMIAVAFYPIGFNLSEEAPALFNFLPMALSGFFVYGGAVVVQHYLLRYGLVREQIIPTQLVSLLNEGVQLGIMRRVGGGFIFIHRYILDYFSTQSSR